MADRFNLERFVAAQDDKSDDYAGISTFEQACRELRNGHKRGHWMWFIFPQVRGLGNSENAVYFAISSSAEAKAYLQHRVLGRRLIKCARLANKIGTDSIDDIFGRPDNKKFQSSMTLFAKSIRDNKIFVAALEKYFGGTFDQNTIDILDRGF